MSELSIPRAPGAPRQKLSVRIVDEVRAMLRSGDLRPGQQLPTESRLCETYGVSRTVVREAIAMLSADRLVEARHGVGVFATERGSGAFSGLNTDAGDKISTALSVLEVRMGIEVESAGLAAERRNPSQDAAVQEALLEFGRLVAIDAVTGKTDFAFHRAIATATNNPFYVEVLDALGSRTIPCDVTSPWGTDSVLTREYQESLLVEHAQIQAAISEGDGAAARRAMRAHLSNSQARYRIRLREQSANYTARGKLDA